MFSDADNRLLAHRVGQRLSDAGLRLATVESCTGGWIAKTLTDIAGSSAWFECGLVTYSNDAKRRLAGVDAATLDRHGAVSRATVIEMARGGLAYADVSVAVSGIAGPGGAVAGKPVGTVWLAWGASAAGEPRFEARVETLPGDREDVRRATVGLALRGVLSLLDGADA